MRSSTSYFYKPDCTTGYWPSESDPGAVDSESAMGGHYALTSNYTGNVALDVPDNVNFLAPIELSSPQFESVVPLDDEIVFRWTAVPNVLGYHAHIFGMEGSKTLIVWDSSEVRDLLGKTVCMAPDRVDVIVPAGIFKDCDMVMLQMIGYGPGAALDKDQPLPRVQTKTTLMVMLGGKKMPRGRGAFDQPPP
jgi:hypothetical protein